MAGREEEIKWASKLQQLLGECYGVHYDACESGMTFFYYGGKLYKRVENSAMNGSINVNDFRAPGTISEAFR